MLYVGLDLSRKRLDWLALDSEGEPAGVGAAPPDRDGLAQLGRRLGDAAVLAVIESMSGARFVHDQLELAGWDVRIADAAKARGLAPLACKTDRLDCWVLAELARRKLVPEIWLPDPRVRPSASAPASASTWSNTAAPSRTGCTRPSSSTVSPTRTATSSGPAAAVCCSGSSCPIPGPRRLPPASS